MALFVPVDIASAVLVTLDSPLITIVPATILAFGTYYVFYYAKVPTVVVRDGPLRKFLDTHVPALKERTWPTPWLVHPWIHTILSSLISAMLEPLPNYRREILPLWDGGEIALDWLDTPDKSFHTIAIVLPGITGDSKGVYLRQALKIANSMNTACVVLNYRGLGGHPVKTTRLYCCSNSEDLAALIEHVHNLHPNATLVGLGFSMGGMLLTRYISESAEIAKQRLTAVMTFSTPYDPDKSTDSLSKGINKIFDFLIAWEMRRIIANEKEMICPAITQSRFEQAMKSNSIRDFDSNFTAPSFGYRDAMHYYTDAKLDKFIPNTSVPLLVICAIDDPFVPTESLPADDVRHSARAALILTEVGGHLGFREGIFGQYRFTSRVWSQLLEAVIHHTDELKAV